MTPDHRLYWVVETRHVRKTETFSEHYVDCVQILAAAYCQASHVWSLLLLSRLDGEVVERRVGHGWHLRSYVDRRSDRDRLRRLHKRGITRR